MTNELQQRLDGALYQEYRKLYGQGDRRVYCWLRYLSRLKGFNTVSLGDLLANIGAFSDHIVVADPSASLREGPVPMKRLIVARRDFAIKCLAIGLPDLYSMRFKMPRRWSIHDQLGLEFKLT